VADSEARPRELRVYLASRFGSAAAMTLLRAAVAWHVFDLSHSAFQLGLVGLVQFVPALALVLVGGAAADVYERRRIMILSQLAALAGSALLCVETARGQASLPLLYGVIFAVSCAAAFENPARMALLPTLVSRDAFPRAVTVVGAVTSLAFATGPALGGLVIAARGVAAAYAANALLLGFSLAGLAALRPGPRETEGGRVTWRAIREGVSFVRSRPVVWSCMLLDMFAVVFGGASALLPIYAERILQVGARGYGLLTSSLELGSLVMALALMLRPPIVRAGRALVTAVVVYGLATIVFGLSRSFPLSLAAYALAGMADQVSVVMRGTAIQLSTPDALRGRVSSVNMLFIGASNQLGAVESGFVAALTTATFSVVSGGLGCLAVVAAVAWGVPELRRYRLDRPAPRTEATPAAARPMELARGSEG